VCDVATVQYDKTRDRIPDLKEPLARAVFLRQVEEQVAMHDIRLPSCLALTRPHRSEDDAVLVQPLVQALTQFREECAIGIITGVRAAVPLIRARA
jgi:hypothetical protein